MSDRYLCKAKRTDNGEWVKGCLLIDYITGQHFIHQCGNSVNESAKIGEEGFLRFLAFEVDPETICQYTGLTDKNGKKIWENDIVRHCSYIGIVKFGQYSRKNYGFYIQWINGDEDLREDFIYWVPKIRRPGYIFDNLELLGGDSVDTN